MATEVRPCVECQGAMSPIVIMDMLPRLSDGLPVDGPLMYRLPGDRASFWMRRYPTAKVVQAYLCAGCGRIALYGRALDAEPGAAADGAAQ